jgi:hypothetical protein
MTELIIYCPKCGSEDCKTEWLTKPEPKRKSIDEVASPDSNRNFAHSVHIIHRYRCSCNGCGYAKEYES